MPHTPTTFAPFVHPKRDRYLARARHLAAAVLAISQGFWFAAFLQAVRHGTPLDPIFSSLGLFGLFFLASRSSQMAAISLGIVDRAAGMEGAPVKYEIFRRAGLGIIVPILFLILGYLRREDSAMMILCMAGVALCEMLFRLGGYAAWRSSAFSTEMLRHLLGGRPAEALESFRKSMPLGARGLEEGALAIAGVAIRQNNPAVLADLSAFLESQPSTGIEGARSLAVVRADHARLADAGSAAPAEAQALRLVPAGHPRRLSLGLFVATAALDQDDPESAIKALRLLHSRDVLPSHGRVIVDWLLLEAAKRCGDSELAARCIEALRTFDVRRVAAAMTVEERTGGGDDPTARWIRRARESLQRGEPFV